MLPVQKLQIVGTKRAKKAKSALSKSDRKLLKQFKNFRSKYPAKSFGMGAIPRTNDTLARYGKSYRGATDAQKANRDTDRYWGGGLYHGRGFYKGFGADVGRTVGSWFGLGDLGAKLGQAGADYTGFGDYTLGNDTIGGSNTIPTFGGGGDAQGDTCITYREYVCDIYGPENTSFGNQIFHLNPGMEATFPFLSQLAQNYEEYQFAQLMFHFRSSIAPIGASGSGQVGEIIMSTNYNPASDPYTDKQTMLSAALSMSGRVTQNQNHGVECDPSKLSMAVGKYIRSGPIPQDEDLKTYDHGLLNVAVSGIPTEYVNQPVGQLWVAYTVMLRKPKKFTSQGWGISRDVFINGDDFGGPLTGAHILTATDNPNDQWDYVIGQQNRIGCLVTPHGVGSNATDIIFPSSASGNYKVRLYYETAVQQDNLAFNLAFTGNVEPIFDIYGENAIPALNKGSWTCCISDNLTATTAGSGNQGVLEFHVRVSLSTGGNENIVSIQTTNTITAPSALPISNAQLDIEEYNTQFNYKQDGTNDRIICVDNTDTIFNI